MLISDLNRIGEKLFQARKRMGLTQSEVAETAGLSDRTYADIERGHVNMRIETFIQICNALHVTPNDILTEQHISVKDRQAELQERLSLCTPNETETVLQLLSVYLDSLNK